MQTEILPRLIDMLHLLDELSTGILILKSDFTVFYWNSTLEEWTGVNRDGILGKDIRKFYDKFSEPDIEQRIQHILNTGESGSCEGEDCQYLIPSMKTTGKMRVQKTIAKRIQFESEGESYIMFELNDKTESAIQLAALQHEIAERKVIQEKLIEANYAMDSELEMARHIQERLIPTQSPSSNIAFYYKPMEKVGGDFFDFINYLNPDWQGLFMSDVSGHGIPAAFITSMIRSFNMQFAGVINEPSQMLYLLNQFLLEQMQGYYVTVFYGIYDKTMRRLTYSMAGHPPPFIISKNSVERIDFSNTFVPIGMYTHEELKVTKKKYTDISLVLEPGDKVFMYTDGITETININAEREFVENGKELNDFEHMRLKQILLENYDKSPAAIIDIVIKALKEFRGSEHFEDDICCVCMEVE